MTQQPMPSFRQQALALGMAAVVTLGMLAGVTGLAGSDQAAHLAQQMQIPTQTLPQAQAAQPAPSA